MCWRKSLDSMQKRMLAVMNNNIPDIPHDVALIVGEDKVKMSCHKIFLAIISPVFEAMFRRRHSTQEIPTTGMEIVSISSTSECNPIVIPDVQPEGLKNVIKYAYTGVINVELKDVTATMYASQKYDIPELTQHCLELLNSNISVNSVVTIYQVSELLNEVKPKEKAWEFIERNAAALLDSEQFVEFSEENLLKFLHLDEMPCLKSEADVFKALLKWGNFQCDQKGLDRTTENMRTVLKNAISLIRYPAMEAHEFTEIVVASEMLRSKECIQLLTYFLSSGEKRVEIANKLTCSMKNRTETGKTIILCTATNNENLATFGNCCSGDHFTITGNVTDLKLKSLGVVFPRNSNIARESISIYLNGNSITTYAAKMIDPKILEICYIEFDVPVCLTPNVRYTIYINCRNGNHVNPPLGVSKYSKELLSKSIMTWTTANSQQATLNFDPMDCVIWAMQFEN